MDQEAESHCQQVATPTSLPSHVLMSWVTLAKPFHPCFPLSTLSQRLMASQRQNCSLAEKPPGSGTLALWVSCDGYNCRSAQLRLANKGGKQDTNGAASSLLSMPSSTRRLDTEEGLARQADHGGVQPCRGEEGEAQMAADALISEND